MPNLPFKTAIREQFESWFHKRNIIIVSERQVRHVPIAGRTQFIVLMAMAIGVSWASYSTGGMMAARTALKEQSSTLRSIASARVEDKFTGLSPASMLPSLAAHERQMERASFHGIFKLTSDDNVRLFTRVALLEKQMEDLEMANSTIIQRVREKSSDTIEDLESILKQTGLNVASLRKMAPTENPVEVAGAEHSTSQGGPYIPDSAVTLPPEAGDMFKSLDEAAMLRAIVGELPLAAPLRNAEEQSNYGRRIDPFTGRMAFHSGLDMSGPYGAKVYSPADGTVIKAGVNGMYGNSIDIRHKYGVTTRYGHLSAIRVKEGDVVSRGQLIGVQGSTGRSTGPHLHYEVRYQNKTMNPKNFIQAGKYAAQK